MDKFSGGVEPANPQFQLAQTVHRQYPQEGVNRFGGEDKVDGPQLGESQLLLLPQVCGPPLLAKSTCTLGFPNVNVDEVAGGAETLCPLYQLPHQQALRACGLLWCMRAAGEVQEVGVGVGGWVGQATMLRQGHCKRNESCIGGQRHGKVLNLKNLVNIHANGNYM